MAENVAIALNNVSKCFKRYGKPSDRLKEVLMPGKIRAQEFWALRDINLEVRRGETLGVIGQNGSGKSTLLQIIAGTLTPTTGEVRVNGRVSALLELGSGFNPEFTGRQNVFFNGQILGLGQKEIAAKFDKIAGFADIGDFIDQPVKTYSSGMFVRLAFAVAINVDPDILIVDEALAVGDVFFQAKCFKMLRNIQENGASILFVSHDISSVQSLCGEAVLLHQGRCFLRDTPRSVANEYYRLARVEVEELEQPVQISVEMPELHKVPRAPNENYLHFTERREPVEVNQEYRVSNGRATIQSIFMTDVNQNPKNSFLVGDNVCVAMVVEFHADCNYVTVGFGLQDRHGRLICGKHTWFDSPGPIPEMRKETFVEFVFSLNLDLRPGEYLAVIGVAENQNTEADYSSLDIIHNAFAINVMGKPQNWGLVKVEGEVEVKQYLVDMLPARIESMT